MTFSKFHLSRKWQTTSLVATGIISIFSVAMVIAGFKSTLPHNDEPGRPNFMIILLGDMGYSDVSWNNPGVKSPHLETLMKSGIKLEHYYTHPLNIKSRVELLSGKYSHRWDSQKKINGESECSLAERLQKLGYATHYIGKWQIKDSLPEKMGFKSFYGSLHGDIDAWTKCRIGEKGQMAVDWPTPEDTPETQTHANDLIANRTLCLLETFNQTQPFFLVISFISPRTTHQTPEQYKTKFKNRDDVWRQEFLGYVQHLDNAVAEIVRKTAELSGPEWFTIAISDGGEAGGAVGLSSRYPLRGGPGSVFDGGIRVPAFITGGQTQGFSLNQPFHVTDWMPTILKLARKPLNSSVDDFDGIDQSGRLVTQEDGGPEKMAPSPSDSVSCREIIHDIDTLSFNYTGEYPVNLTTHGNLSTAAISCWPYKLVLDIPGVNDQWDENKLMKPQIKAGDHETSLDRIYYSSKDAKCNGSTVVSTDRHRLKLTPHAHVKIYLFNIEDDPEETEDIGTREPSQVNDLLGKLYCHAKHISFPVTARYQCIRNATSTS